VLCSAVWAISGSSSRLSPASSGLADLTDSQREATPPQCSSGASNPAHTGCAPGRPRMPLASPRLVVVGLPRDERGRQAAGPSGSEQGGSECSLIQLCALPGISVEVILAQAAMCPRRAARCGGRCARAAQRAWWAARRGGRFLTQLKETTVTLRGQGAKTSPSAETSPSDLVLHVLCLGRRGCASRSRCWTVARRASFHRSARGGYRIGAAVHCDASALANL